MEALAVGPEPGSLNLDSFYRSFEKIGNYGVIYGPSYAIHGRNVLFPQVS